ncbi:peptidylprolyl isomerase [Leptolyngbya sp. 15MV]|nr:peptidylprolyl isomerase [Leptolyngbya sp. 15MV]
MNKPLLSLATVLALALPAAAQDAPQGAPSPGEIVAAAPAADWIAIAPEDLIVMTLAPDAAGEPRRVMIQLMPAPFSQGWVANIRTLARANWYDGIAVTRVQDNYVVQWGDPNGEDAAKAKPLPEGLRVMTDADYAVGDGDEGYAQARADLLERARIGAEIAQRNIERQAAADKATRDGSATAFIPRPIPGMVLVQKDPYAGAASFSAGWPVGIARDAIWPVHCYGMVGVGRNYSPDTGTGAELYTVIGHAPRHLDRNIALVGRVVEGIEHLSSLPRGTGALGFYETPAEHTPILSIRVASDLPAAAQPRFQYLSTESESFARYAEARANRRDPFFIVPAGGADICNIPVPVRRAP